MPLARYQIRNECGLADPELYKAADKDDPEALLEGVAMAGLVGVLRQLGDLAEFAAEVFHDLHEEVLATAARGHGLMARVQQLEVEFPSIEKSFLAQTHQTPFFTNSGVDWHPNLRMEQNMITRGDLPRFVMDSYEECRGPPRLFLLDKFDVAGAGACLKRYTDPSFFKVEAASYGVPTAEVQREKKNRKVKKKGARWRNGETPEVVSTSHAKLHELFLEERVENAHSDPARIVKLKRRQLNGFPFDPKPGKSYMERFLGTPSPEHKVVHEVSVNPPLLRLTLDNSCESGLEIIEISAISPSKKSSQGRESNCSSPSSQEVVLKPVTPELNEEAMNREFVKVPDPISGGEADESPCFVHKMANEDELEVDEDRKTEGSLEGDHSDDLMSEVDNYIDALATMESEMETDNECKPKSDIGFLMLGRHGTDSDANEEHSDLQVNFSDSQSYGNSSMSEDGKSSFKKGRSSFSYSNSLSNLAENTPSDNEGVVKVSSSEKSAAKIIDSPMDHLSVLVENQGNDFSDLMCIGEDRTPNARKASCTSCVSDSNTLLLPSVPIVNSIVISSAESAETELDEMPSDCIKHGSKTSNTDQNETALPDSSVVISNVPSQTVHNSLAVSSDDCLVEELDHEDPNVLVCMANMSDLKKEGDDGTVYDVLQTEYTDGIYHKNLVEGKFGAPDSVISPCSVNEEHQTEYADGICDKNLVAGKIGSPHSIISPLKEQLPCSVLPKAAMDSDVALTSDNSDVLKPTQINSEVDDVIAATEHNSENLINMAVTPKLDSIEENQCSDIAVNISQVEHNLKVGMTYSKENIMRLEEISGAADGADLDGCTDKVDKVGEDSVPFEHPANYSDKSDLGHLNLDEDVDASPDTVAVTTGAEDHVNDASCPPSDLVCSKSSDLLDIQEFPFGNEDPDLNGLDSNGGVLPEHCTEPKEQEELKQLEVAPTESKSHLSESISVGNSNVQALENIDKSAFTYQEENSSYFSDAIVVPSSEWSNQEVESKHASLNHSEDGCEDAACSPTCCLQGVETYFEHSVELQAEQAFAESPSADMHEDSSESLNLQHSPSCRLADSGIPSDHSLELQSDQLDLGCSQVDEACSRSYMQSEQVQSVSDIGQERCLDATSRQEALPSQELLVQSVGHKLSSTALSRNPFDSVFPSLGPLPENLEEMPPLPPLPPMQWRMGKFQPTSLASQGEWISHGKHTFLPMHPSIADENTVGIEITHRSNPFLSVASGDIQKLEHLYAEYEENSMQPTPLSLGMPTSVRDATNQQGLLLLEATQSLNPFLNLPETINERPEFDFLAPGGNPLKSSSDPLSPVATVEDEPTEHDPVPSHGSQTKPLNQVMPESISEAKVSEQSLQSSEVEQNYLDKSVLPPTRIEDQPQHDLVTMHGETWPPSTLALPPTYEVGKPNGSKLPRPRNPLIDAVAAHDKSKLKKVTERVHPRVGPKADERDSLLQQIRTKSFNLKPMAVTRPSIQGIQGPKTNLKVAAILEKANAIRQALAGSDEDNDTDSWSDS